MSYTLIIPEGMQIEMSEALDSFYDVSTAVCEKFFNLLAEAYNYLVDDPKHYSFYGDSKLIRASFPYKISLLHPVPYC